MSDEKRMKVLKDNLPRPSDPLLCTELVYLSNTAQLRVNMTTKSGPSNCATEGATWMYTI